MPRFKRIRIPLKQSGFHQRDRRRILVVDDDLDTVEAMALLLKSCEHEVAFAITGSAAIDAARRFRPEVAVIDVHLPDLDGDTVARKLRSEPGMKDFRIIAISGDDDMRARALDAGCAEFYTKPVSLAALERLFRR